MSLLCDKNCNWQRPTQEDVRGEDGGGAARAGAAECSRRNFVTILLTEIAARKFPKFASCEKHLNNNWHITTSQQPQTNEELKLSFAVRQTAAERQGCGCDNMSPLDMSNTVPPVTARHNSHETLVLHFRTLQSSANHPPPLQLVDVCFVRVQFSSTPSLRRESINTQSLACRIFHNKSAVVGCCRCRWKLDGHPAWG